jgi:hypothetical protein
VKEFDSSEDSDSEEDFGWWRYDDEDMYFMMGTKYKNIYKKQQQLFHCYGRRTNRFLLINYGFCLRNNKYNSISFRVYINFGWNKEGDTTDNILSKTADPNAKVGTNPEEESKGAPKRLADDEEGKVSKLIKLKPLRLCEDIFSYLRANLLNSYKGANKADLLVSSPVDFEFEMLVVACAVNLMNGLLESRFKTTLAHDKKLLDLFDKGELTINMRKYFGLIHRMNGKEILHNNIKYCKILLQILARCHGQNPFKVSYMSIVPDFEKPAEVFPNRLKLRKYLREIFMNRARILQKNLQFNNMFPGLLNDGGFEKIVGKKFPEGARNEPISLPDRKVDTKSEDEESGEEEQEEEQKEEMMTTTDTTAAASTKKEDVKTSQGFGVSAMNMAFSAEQKKKE